MPSQFYLDFERNIQNFKNTIIDTDTELKKEFKLETGGYFTKNYNVIMGGFLVTLCAIFESYHRSVLENYLDKINSFFSDKKLPKQLIIYDSKQKFPSESDDLNSIYTIKKDIIFGISTDLQKLEKIYTLFAVKLIPNKNKEGLKNIFNEIQRKRNDYAHSFVVIESSLSDIKKLTNEISDFVKSTDKKLIDSSLIPKITNYK